jgi:hypothetical protein
MKSSCTVRRMTVEVSESEAGEAGGGVSERWNAVEDSPAEVDIFGESGWMVSTSMWWEMVA